MTIPAAPSGAGPSSTTFTPPARPDRTTRGRSILETMKRLQLAAVLPVVGTLDQPCDPAVTLAGLRHAVDDLRARREARPLRPPTAATLEQALAQWAECRPDVGALGPRFTRALCAHAPMLDDEAFLRGLATHPDLPRRRRWLESLIGLYETGWRPTHAELVERLLRDAVGRGEAESARLGRLRPIAAKFFSADAASWLADSALASRRSVLEVLAEYGVPQDAALARATLAVAAQRWADDMCQQTSVSATTLALLDYGLENVLSSTVIESAVLRTVVSRAILWAPERDERVPAALREWLLKDKRFGDPRIPQNQPQWATMASEARQRMIRWLAKGDLLFFFDFVMDHTDDPHRRKEFWLRYIDQVEDSAVALSPADLRRLKLTVSESVRYARVTSSPQDNVSAFLMRFRGDSQTIVIEFSQSGNALYMHDAELFRGGLRKSSYHFTNELKGHASRVGWYAHNPTPGWMVKVANALARRGVRRYR